MKLVVFREFGTAQVPLAEPLMETSRIPSSDGSNNFMGLEEPNEWEIKPADLKLGPRIGMGSYGEVFRGSWRYTDVAVKRLIDQELSPQLLEVGHRLPKDLFPNPPFTSEISDIRQQGLGSHSTRRSIV